MTDNDKLNMIQKYFIEYIQSWEELTDFTQFLDNVTKTKIKTALKNRLQADADKVEKQSLMSKVGLIC